MDEQRFEKAVRDLGGPPIDPLEALEAVRPRLAGAGKRHAAARASLLAALAAVLVAGGVVLAVGNTGRDRVKVGTSDTANVTTTVTTDASSIIVTKPATSGATNAASTDTSATVAEPDRSTSNMTTTAGAAGPPPTATAGRTTQLPTTPRPTAAQTTEATTATTAPPSFATGVFRYETTNGHIDVDVRADSLRLVSYEALNSATSEIKDNLPTRIEVHFHLGNSDSSIRIRLEGGTLLVERKP